VVDLERARLALDDRVHGLEMARVRGQPHVDVARLGLPRPLGAVVVLDVAGAALGVVRDGLDEPLALELAQDDVVRTAHGVGDHVQPPAVRHAEDDVAGAARRSECDRLVEHRHHRVEPLDRELLLTEERAAEVALEPLDLGEPLQEETLLVGSEGLPVATRLDRLAEPHALLVIRDVLDLVGERPAVHRLEARQRVGERVSRAVEPKETSRDARLEVLRQPGHEPVGIERRVAGRIAAERIEPRREMAVHAIGLDERHRRRDAAEELVVRLRRRRLRSGSGRAVRGRPAVPDAEARETRKPLRERLRILLEDGPPFCGHGLRRLEVLHEELLDVAEIQVFKKALIHSVRG
jgi:hypothetical protein